MSSLFQKTQEVTVDNSTHALSVINDEEQQLHEGRHYSICNSEVKGTSETIEFVITTPDTTNWAHMLFDINTSAGFTLHIYEGTDDIVGGTPATPVNNNRNSTNTSGLTILKDPTSTTDGTLLYTFGGGSNQRGGVVSRGDELVLKQNEVYLFRITSLGASNRISYCGDWYEHSAIE
jgi:hypothetical protein